MTNAELGEHLNRKYGLNGRYAVTENVIRQWVGWGVLPKAIAHSKGRARAFLWDRNEVAMRRADRLAELRQFGMVRKSAVIAQVWLEWGHPDFAPIRLAILSEVKRSRAKLLRNLVSDTKHEKFSELSRVRVNALRRQGGPLDDRFRGTPFELSDAGYIRALDAMVTGESPQAEVAKIFGERFTALIPAESGIQGDQLANLFASGLSGVFGEKGEIETPGEATVENASVKNFRFARLIWRKCHFRMDDNYRQLARFFDLMPWAQEPQNIFEQVGPQILSGHWAVCAFVMILHAIENLDENSNNFDFLRH